MSDICTDDRFEKINELKNYILEFTNISSRPDEMAFLDSFCFRLWQLGLTLDTKKNAQKYEDLENNLECLPDVVSYALEHGIYYNGIYIKEPLHLIYNPIDKDYILCFNNGNDFVYLRDYKKTWWIHNDVDKKIN